MLESVPPPEPVTAPEPMTLAQLLAALSDLDEAPEVIFTPEQIIGDLKDKVDAIYTVLSRLESEEERLAKIAADFASAARAVHRNRDRLKEYVRYEMQAHGFEKVPGKRWRLQLQKAAPALVCEREATADDLLANPNLVTRKVSYAWSKDAIKEHLAAGGTFDYGKLVQSQSVRFYLVKGQSND